MTPTKKWQLNDTGIIRSLESVFKAGDITKLTKDAYNFTMNISGFIAHYNHGGFMDHYQDLRDFKRDLINSSDVSSPDYYINDRFFSEGEQAEYYAKKSKILRAIPAIVEKYAGKIDEDFTSQEKAADLAQAAYLQAKWQ